MSYFSHAFKKTFVMSSYSQPNGSKTTADLAKGEVSIFNSKTWANVLPSGVDQCCPFIIAAGAPYTNDKIGPFHGGYKESIKSKGINSKYVTKVWNSFASEAQPAVLHIGTTLYTQEDQTAACCPEFLCGENYHLRVDVKGSPALRMLNHQGYVEVTANGGCCPDDAIDPTPVNPTDIMIQWAKGLWESVVVTGNGPNFNPSNPASADRVNPNPFFVPVVTVTDNTGAVDTLLFPPGWLGVYGPTAAEVAAQAGPAIVEANVIDWDSYVVPAYEEGLCAGLTLTGAYEETKFGTCTFQPSDFYGLEPVRLYASEVDLNGDPCAFTGICVVNECLGKQAQGLGETALRDFILSESYRQNPFATDLRIREITQGTDMIDSVGGVYKDKLYDRLFIQHTVPRYNNPSGTFDNDQYVIEILTEADGPLGPGSQARAALLSDLQAIFLNCSDGCIDIADGETVDCPFLQIPVVPSQLVEVL